MLGTILTTKYTAYTKNLFNPQKPKHQKFN